MHYIGWETINSNISQKAMNRNRSRKKAKKKYEKLPFTFRQIDLHACSKTSSTVDIYDADEVFEKWGQDRNLIQ